MNFQVDPLYLAAVQGYALPHLTVHEENSEGMFSERDLETLTEAIAKHIVGANDLRPKLAPLLGQEPSLLETSLVVVQGQDKKNNVLTTVSRIEKASEDEKKIFGKVFRKLSDLFVFQPDDLKGVALLFGIHRIHDLALGILPLTQQIQNRLQEVQGILAFLVGTRSTFDAATLSQEEQVIVAEWDAKILQAQAVVEELTEELYQCTAAV